tara:strand:+ start:180 stop:593 length:414 start_codon:yes stop_codon:yes gene_type:complete
MNKNRAVIPVQVVEEVTRKTLDESTVSYIVSLPDKDRSTISLDEIDSAPFSSLDSVRDHMIKNAKDAIESIIEKSRKTSTAFFGNAAEEIEDAQDKPEEIETAREESEDILQGAEKLNVDLGGGMKARIDLSGLDKS